MAISVSELHAVFERGRERGGIRDVECGDDVSMQRDD